MNQILDEVTLIFWIKRSPHEDSRWSSEIIQFLVAISIQIFKLQFITWLHLQYSPMVRIIRRHNHLVITRREMVIHFLLLFWRKKRFKSNHSRFNFFTRFSNTIGTNSNNSISSSSNRNRNKQYSRSADHRRRGDHRRIISYPKNDVFKRLSRINPI